MKIKSVVDEKYEEPEIHVCHRVKDRRALKIVTELKGLYEKQLMAMDMRGNKCMLSAGSISRIFAQKQKVYAVAEGQSYELSQKLYELESELDEATFIRISRHEIINMHKIKMLDMNTMGTIKVIMQDGAQTYTSRRNVTRLKKALEGERDEKDNKKMRI